MKKSLDQYDFINGEMLLVNKPMGWTSFDVVNKIRFRLKYLLNVKKIKVGHAGTLDPMATGLLIICTGKFTKKLSEYQGLDKTYEGTLRLGGSTPSYDGETEVEAVFPVDHITGPQINAAAESFIGKINQVPPVFSAIKVDGQPLYKRARKGEKVKIKSREVEISKFEITSVEMPSVSFEVNCSKGTYIRSLAHDFGIKLKSGAYLSALKRTAIGGYNLEDAWQLDELITFLGGVSKSDSQ